jgi:hypothetical protein
MEPKVHDRVHKSLPMVPILSDQRMNQHQNRISREKYIWSVCKQDHSYEGWVVTDDEDSCCWEMLKGKHAF